MIAAVGIAFAIGFALGWYMGQGHAARVIRARCERSSR